MIRGLLAGAIGGLAGAGAKQLCETIAPPRAPGRDPPPGLLAAKVVRAAGGGDLTTEQKERVSLAIHWIFSTATGAAYGASLPADAKVRLADGLGFGMVVWAGFHEFALPLLGATPPLADLPASEQVNEFVSHAIFGATVESVRALTCSLLAASSFDD